VLYLDFYKVFAVRESNSTDNVINSLRPLDHELTVAVCKVTYSFQR